MYHFLDLLMSCAIVLILCRGDQRSTRLDWIHDAVLRISSTAMTMLPGLQPCLLGRPRCTQCICPRCLPAGTWKSYSNTLAAVYNMPSIGVITVIRFLNVQLETIYMSYFILIPRPVLLCNWFGMVFIARQPVHIVSLDYSHVLRGLILQNCADCSSPKIHDLPCVSFVSSSC